MNSQLEKRINGSDYDSLSQEGKIIYNLESIRKNVQFFGWILIVSIISACLLGAGLLLYCYA